MAVAMAKVCVITNKKSQVGGAYANRTRATVFTPTGSVRRYPNLQTKKVFVPELNKSISVTASVKGFRTLSKNGPFKTLKKAGLI
jgi:large subunit ribosomal protein L28